jgi:hypothetical protein
LITGKKTPTHATSLILLISGLLFKISITPAAYRHQIHCKKGVEPPVEKAPFVS